MVVEPVQEAGGEQGEGDHVPGAAVDAAVGEQLAVVGELQFAAHEAVRELSGLDIERADVAGDRLALALGFEVGLKITSKTP